MNNSIASNKFESDLSAFIMGQPGVAAKVLNSTFTEAQGLASDFADTIKHSLSVTFGDLKLKQEASKGIDADHVVNNAKQKQTTLKTLDDYLDNQSGIATEFNTIHKATLNQLAIDEALGKSEKELHRTAEKNPMVDHSPVLSNGQDKQKGIVR